MDFPLVYRKNNKFHVNEEKLPPHMANSQVISQLLIAIFYEFRGAVKSEKYKDLTNQEKLDKINDFAKQWIANNEK